MLFLPIWAGCQFQPTRVRLIGWGAELLLRMEINSELRITVDFGELYFHIGQGGWQAVTYNGGNRRVFPPSPTARGFAKLEEYFAQMGNCVLEGLSVRVDCGEIAEVAESFGHKARKKKE